MAIKFNSKLQSSYMCSSKAFPHLLGQRLSRLYLGQTHCFILSSRLCYLELEGGSPHPCEGRKNISLLPLRQFFLRV